VTLVSGAEVYAVLSGLVDFDAERVRLSKQEKDLEKDVAKLEKKLSNPGYLAKAKPEIIEKDKAKFEDAKGKLDMVRTQLAELG
jgi:valyl-tRNA synthetase